MGKPIPALKQEAILKRRIRRHLRSLGFQRDKKGELVPPDSSKETVRALHALQRRERLKANGQFISDRFRSLREHFASGGDIDVNRVTPHLELIEASTWQSDLFRLASLSWSVPVSSGFGRRMRYLVWDSSNRKLMGIIALGDPVFNLRARDDLVGWSVADRAARLVNVMDAYVLGALPPYNMLLGGKLIASLVRTQEVRDDFKSRYAKTTGIISQENKQAQLVMVTTSSALGRSSVYNRLKLEGQTYLSSIGYTGGWGHFHVPDSLFVDLRKYLRRFEHRYVDGHKFGEGPNWRLRTIRAAFDALGIKPDLIRHGIKREVFACELAVNAHKILRGERKRAVYRNLKSVDEVGRLARERWMIPRAMRRQDYREWNLEFLEELLKPSSKALPINMVASA